ncbi:hypothetical protein Fot_11763 [Forsythia ovata]|uniref:Uncharacterized protein n=1 Tax=Forsythia ovata TaxID=205694 RepID=A0ABD1WNG4_9LAMI
MRFLRCSYYGRPNTCYYFKLVDHHVHPHYNSVINSLLQNVNREVVGDAMGMVVTTSNGWILLSTHIIKVSSMVCCRMLTRKLLASVINGLLQNVNQKLLAMVLLVVLV